MTDLETIGASAMGFIRQLIHYFYRMPACAGLIISERKSSSAGTQVSALAPVRVMQQRDVYFNQIQRAIDGYFGQRFRLVNFMREHNTVYAQLEHIKKGYTLVAYSDASLDQSWDTLYSTAGEFCASGEWGT